MRLATVIGARPQFIKATMVSRALRERGIQEVLIHTGQHYDDRMSRIFFEELGLPEPTIHLGVGSGSHAGQTGRMMTALEEALGALAVRPSALMVYGDTNSTLAGALVGAKLGIPVVHVEAGLRSFNKRMPEEINRVVADRLSDLLLCPSHTALALLEKEGMADRAVFTGDVMYDALLHFRGIARLRAPLSSILDEEPGSYVLLTAHRAENVDDSDRLGRLLGIVGDVALPVIWPIHPRTRARIAALGRPLPSNVTSLEPVGYLAMLSLLTGARRVLTDSGGLQKEALWMRVPCITLRTETEWPETLQGGWNRVTDLDPQRIQQGLAADPTDVPADPYGDGSAAPRVADELMNRTFKNRPE